MLELCETIQTVVALATLANIKELKLAQEEYVHLFITVKDIVYLLPTGFGKRLIYTVSGEVGSIAILLWSMPID